MSYFGEGNPANQTTFLIGDHLFDYQHGAVQQPEVGISIAGDN